MNVNMTGSLDQESLFSLEVVVERLTLNEKVVCRFPAVAFRLLDFPTLIIYHVEEDLADTIRTKINADPHYHIPNQLYDLQDRNGGYLLKRGKSCLFKVAPNALLSHLSSAPLYAMVIDTYPEVAKLVGNCTVPLDEVMNEVYDDICKLGIAVPAVRGEKKLCKVYSLMGIEVGDVKFGYRLLSLGVGLMSHIPNTAISKLGKSEGVVQLDQAQLTGSSAMTKDVKDRPITQDIQAADKDIQVEIYNPIVEKDIIRVTMAEPQQGNWVKTVSKEVGLQTNKTRKSKQGAKNKMHQHQHISELDDIFVTNTVCPPPLYYNSDCQPQTLLPPTVLQDIQNNTVSKLQNESDSEDDSTIRAEDKFSDSDYEEVDFETSKIVKKEKENSPARNARNVKVTDPAQHVQNVTDFTNMPLLNALVKEIMSLKGQGQGTSAKDIPELKSPRTPHSARTVKQVSIETKPRPQSARKSRDKSQSVGIAQSNTVTVDNTPKKWTRTYYQGQQMVPKNKSWLRNVPECGKKKTKTKLLYGMTNAQRLRLAKTNPDLLKTLEKEEEERINTFRKQKGITILHKNKFDAGKVNTRTMDISTEIQKHDMDESMPVRDSLTLSRFGESFDSKGHKKPVPTPRKSIHNSREQQEIQKWLDMRRSINTNDFTEEVSHHSSRSKSIEVHVPTVSAHDGIYSDATSMYESELEEEPKPVQSQTRTLAAPKVEKIVEVQKESARSTVQYSDDFENVNELSVEEPQLRKIVDKYSDDDDDTYHSAKSKESKKSDKMTISLPYVSNPTLPTVSSMSPTVALAKNLAVPTREPVGASGSTVDPNLSGESTAYIPMSEIQSSLESVEDEKEDEKKFNKQLPKPSPRRAPPLQRTASVRTESVSSFAPSDEESASPRSPKGRYRHEYSESFEDVSEEDENEDIVQNIQPMRNLQLAQGARMAYTWSQT